MYIIPCYIKCTLSIIKSATFSQQIWQPHEREKMQKPLNAMYLVYYSLQAQNEVIYIFKQRADFLY